MLLVVFNQIITDAKFPGPAHTGDDGRSAVRSADYLNIPSRHSTCLLRPEAGGVIQERRGTSYIAAWIDRFHRDRLAQIFNCCWVPDAWMNGADHWLKPVCSLLD